MTTDGRRDDGGRQARPSWWGALKTLPARMRNHNVTVAAAGIAFYGLLALVPTLVATVSIYGLVNQGNEEEIKDQIESAAGSLDESTRDFVTNQLQDITSSDGNLLALLLSIALALFSASGAVQKLMGTISVAYEAEEGRPGWRVRLLAYAFTAGAIVAVVTMVFLIGVLPEILDRVDLGTAATTAINLVRLPAFGLFFILALTVLYRYSADRPVPTPWRNPGAWVATGLWLLFAIAFSIYSGNIGAMPASYGLLGTVAALMIFLQLTSIAVILGAEFNAAWEESAVPEAASLVGRSGLVAGAVPGGSPSDRPGATPATAAGDGRPVGLVAAVLGLAALAVLGRAGRR